MSDERERAFNRWVRRYSRERKWPSHKEMAEMDKPVQRVMFCQLPEGMVTLSIPEPLSVESLDCLGEIVATLIAGFRRSVVMVAVTNDGAWDERKLGHDEAFAARASPEQEAELDAAIPRAAKESK